MSISMELMIVIVVNVMTAGIFLGGLAMSIKFIEQQIKRLEEKQDKHNNLVERMVKVEESTKSAHKRLDILDKKK
jgi:hypothetical protein|nr:MAG TPA: Hemolysin [Caudoviricetes sp.]